MSGVNFTHCQVFGAYKKILLPITYGIVFLFGLGLNGTVLWLVCCRTKTWRGSVIYLANLAVADLLYVLTLPLLVVSYAMEDVWLFGNVACKAVRFLFYTNLHCSMMFLTSISVHRFLGVCYPIRAMAYRTNRFAALASALIWILVTTEIVPTLAFAHTGFIDDKTVCFDMTNPGDFQQYFPYGMFLTLVGFLAPFLVICTCYCSIVRALSRPPENIKVGTKRRRKSVRTILVVCLLFVLCFVPYHINRTIYIFVRVYMVGNCRVLNSVMLSFKIWKPIVSFNSCINPVLYFVCSDRHRKQLLAHLRKKKVHPSIRTVQTKTDEGHNRVQRTSRYKNDSFEGLRNSCLTTVVASQN